MYKRHNLQIACFILGLGLSGPALADDSPAADSTPEALEPRVEHTQLSPWEVAILGGFSVTRDEGGDDNDVAFGLNHGSPMDSAVRLGYWMNDWVSLQASGGSNGFAALGAGGYFASGLGYGHGMVGIALSRPTQGGKASPFAAVNIGSYFWREGKEADLAPFLGVEAGLRYGLNERVNLRLQGGAKPLIGAEATFEQAFDLSLGIGARF